MRTIVAPVESERKRRQRLVIGIARELPAASHHRQTTALSAAGAWESALCWIVVPAGCRRVPKTADHQPVKRRTCDQAGSRFASTETFRLLAHSMKAASMF